MAIILYTLIMSDHSIWKACPHYVRKVTETKYQCNHYQKVRLDSNIHVHTLNIRILASIRSMMITLIIAAKFHNMNVVTRKSCKATFKKLATGILYLIHYT